MRIRSWIMLAAAVAGAGCGGSGGTYGSGPSNNNPGSSTSKQITVKNNSFDPSGTTVPAGSTVTWSWAQGSTIHNVTFSDGPKSADQSTGTFSRLFDKSGTYLYNCTIHPGMSGSVTVQ